MKKYLLAALSLLVAATLHAQTLSLFTWEPGVGPTGHFTADIGPNGSSCGTLGNKRASGNGSPNGLAPGSQLVPLACCSSFCPVHSSCTNPVGYDLNFTVPAATSVFNRGSMTWRIDFNRRNNEAAANFFDRGTSLRFGSDCCGIVYIQYRITQAAAPGYEIIGSPDPGTGGFTGATEGETTSNTGSNQWFTHTFVYDSVSGIGEVWRNDFATPRWSSASIGKARPGQSLYWATAPASFIIGRRCDGMATGNTAFDNATIFAPVPTPVTLTYFRGSNHGFETLLEWETTSETNSDYFQLERYDGEKNEWIPVGTVDAAGNSTVPRSYRMLDRNPHSGSNIYVLRQFDLNGSNRPATNVEVYFEGFADRVIEVYPNPVQEGEEFNVRFEASADRVAKMSITNLEGQQIRSFEHDTYAGVNTFSFSTEGLPAGMYLFKSEVGSKNSTKKFVVVR